MNIVLLGPPGAGKGTQGERIAQRLGIPKLATGDVLCAAVRDGTEQGLRAKSFMDRGDLVPDAVILEIMKEALARPEAARGVILDGVVRTVPEAVRNRMRAYRAQTAPVIEWYRSRSSDGGPRLITINAAGKVEETTQSV